MVSGESREELKVSCVKVDYFDFVSELEVSRNNIKVGIGGLNCFDD